MKPAQTLRLRDMIQPAGLLERTGWREDPLVVYSERRAMRRSRIVMTRLFELTIVLIGMFGVWVIFHNPRMLAVGVLTPFAILLMLRYHLFVNDQSHQMKALSKHHFQELMLTELGPNEFFLHQLLVFCRSYRLIFCFAVVTGYYLVEFVLAPNRYARVNAFIFLIWTFYIVLQVWVAGIYQYCAEWELFAGGRLSKPRYLISLAFSAALVCIICTVDVACVLNIFDRARDPLARIGVGLSYALPPLAFGFWFTFREAKRLNRDAVAWLKHRLDAASPAPFWLRPLDFLCWWSWRQPATIIPHGGLLIDAAVCGALFTAGMFLSKYLFGWYAFSAWELLRWLVLGGCGAYFGLALARDAAPITRRRIREYAFWMGMISLAVTATIAWPCYDPHLIRLFSGVEAMITWLIQFSIENVTYCMVAFAVAVFWAQRPRRWWLFAGMWLLAALLLVVAWRFIGIVSYWLVVPDRRGSSWRIEEFVNWFTAFIAHFALFIPVSLILTSAARQTQDIHRVGP